MPKNSVTDWDETAGNNTDVGGVDIDEGCAPSGINNAIRTVMAQIKAFFKSTVFRLRDGTDQTKLLAFDLSALTTATTRTLTAPDESARLALAPHLAGHLYGLTLSNNVSDATNDIDIAAGSAIDGTNTHVMTLAAALTKRLDAAWAVGTGNGGLDTGSIANTTYHVHLIKRVDTGVVDALFSTSATAPTLPANYTLSRRIGSIVRTGGAIKAFKQIGDEFLWDASVADVSSSAASPTAATVNLTVPTGIIVDAKLSVLNNASGNVGIWLSSLEVSDQAPGTGGYTSNATGVADAVGPVFVRTNTSGQIRRRESGTSATIFIWTEGFRDTRGRL